MKFLTLILISIFVSTSNAQNSKHLSDLNDKVSSLIKEYSTELNGADRRDVRRALQDIQFIFNDNGIYAKETPTLNLTCESFFNRLVNLDTGGIVYDFNSNENCLEAKDLILKGSPFCDYYDNSLRKTDAILIHDFSSPNDCKVAISRSYVGKNFCDYNDNTLRKYNGDLIYDFDTANGCRDSLK